MENSPAEFDAIRKQIRNPACAITLVRNVKFAFDMNFDEFSFDAFKRAMPDEQIDVSQLSGLKFIFWLTYLHFPSLILHAGNDEKSEE